MKIIITGDYVPRNRIAPLIKDGKFEEIFGDVREIVSSADYSIVNFESPIVEDGDQPIKKSGPNLQCTTKAVDAIKYAGFDCATLANNHIRDFGSDAVNRTINLLQDNGLDFVGAGSVVVKDVPDNCIVAGNPAKIIKFIEPRDVNHNE